MSIVKNKSDDGHEMTICLPQTFDFQLHSEFRDLYESESDVTSMVLDMDKTKYMDSSALGMMLQLKEFTDGNDSKVSIKMYIVIYCILLKSHTLIKYSLLHKHCHECVPPSSY